MKITKSKLKQLIKEEYAGAMYDEGHRDSYNHGDRRPRKEDPEYLKGFEAGLKQKEEETGEGYSSTYTAPVDVDYDPLMREALPPHLQSKVDAYEKKKQKYSITDVTPPGYGPDEPEEEDEPVRLPKLKQDPMGRGSKTSRLRRKVGGSGTGRLEEDDLQE